MPTENRSSNTEIVSVPRPFRRHVHGCPDRLSDCGEWIKTWRARTKLEIVTNHTKAHGLWSKIERRTQAGGLFQRSNPAYIGAKNGFADFQEFAEWCQFQPGYLEIDENGNSWEIDKDILVKGNKVYSPVNCCFVPRRINSLFTSCRSARGDLPLGVSLVKRTGNYRAYCNSGGSLKHLGMYDCPLDAHRAWQEEKIHVISLAAREYDAMPGSRSLVVAALLGRAQMIFNDIHANRVTVEV